jgi:FkbM family methyltransferase
MSGGARILNIAVWSTWDWIPRRHSFRVCLPAADTFFIGEFERRRSFYELDVLLHLAERGPRSGMFLDIGAHVGNHTLFFASFLAEHVISVEPNPEVAALLTRNVAENGIRNVTVVEAGLAARPGRARLVWPEGPAANTGMVSLEQLPETAHEEEGVVDVTTVDWLMQVCELDHPVRLIKIDAEGMQAEIVRGALETIKTHQPHLVIEAATDEERLTIEALLVPLGYHNVARLADTPTYHFVPGGRENLRARRPSAHVYDGLRRLARLSQRAIRSFRRRLSSGGPSQ